MNYNPINSSHRSLGWVKFTFVLFLLMFVFSSSVSYSQEAYAVLDGNTLTFKYGLRTSESNPTFTLGIGLYWEGSNLYPEWYEHSRDKIEKVVFDPSFYNDNVLPKSFKNWFCDCVNLKSVEGLEFIKTTQLEDMSGMFKGCSSLTEIIFPDYFYTSRVTTMSSLFSNCINLTNIVFGKNFYTTSVTDMSGMFYRCEKLQTIDLNIFKTDNVIDMSLMFSGCKSLRGIDVSKFNTSKVTNMRGLFTNCSNLYSLEVSSFNTSLVTDMSDMFAGCSNLFTLDLNSFNTSSVTKMSDMFNMCSKLTTIFVDPNKWSTSSINASYNSSIFHFCNYLIGNQGTIYDDSHIDVDYAHIDGGTSNPGYLTYGNSKVFYDLKGGTMALGNPTSYPSNNSALSISVAPTKIGHTFTGWTSSYTNPNITIPTKNAVIPANSVGNLLFVANYSINQYSVTLPSNFEFVTSNTNNGKFDYNTEVTFKVLDEYEVVTNVTSSVSGVTITENTNGTYTLKVPAENVTISATTKKVITPSTITSFISLSKTYDCTSDVYTTDGKKLDGDPSNEDSYLEYTDQVTGETIRFLVKANYVAANKNTNSSSNLKGIQIEPVLDGTNQQIIYRQNGTSFERTSDYIIHDLFINKTEGAEIKPFVVTSSLFAPTFADLLDQGNVFTSTKVYDGKSTMKYTNTNVVQPGIRIYDASIPCGEVYIDIVSVNFIDANGNPVAASGKNYGAEILFKHGYPDYIFENDAITKVLQFSGNDVKGEIKPKHISNPANDLSIITFSDIASKISTEKVYDATPDVDITDNTYSFVFNNETINATLSNAVYTDQNGDPIAEAGEPYGIDIKVTLPDDCNYVFEVNGELSYSFVKHFSSSEANGKITPANPVVDPLPQKLSLVYSATPQPLVAAGVTSGGTLQYRLETETNYSDNIPEAQLVGDYKIYYRVLGNNNFNSVEDETTMFVISTISTLVIDLNDPNLSIILENDTYEYTGSPIEPKVTVSYNGITIPATEYTVTYKDNINVGTATVTITDNPNGNYTINGTAPFTIKPGKILITSSNTDTDGAILADASNKYFCSGKAIIDFTAQNGTLDNYSLEFEGGQIPTQNGAITGNSIEIALPKDLLPGSYNGTMELTSFDGNSTGKLPIRVNINLPYYTIVTLYNDVAAVNQLAGEFSAYKWTENGSEISGANSRLLQYSFNKSSVYTAILTKTDGNSYETCPLDLSRITEGGTEVNVYPNPGNSLNDVYVEITCNYQPDANNRIFIYNLNGSLIKQINTPQEKNTLQLPSGNYSGIYLQNGEKVPFKLIVK